MICRGCGDISLDDCSNRGGLCSFCDGISKELATNPTEDYASRNETSENKNS